MTLQELKIEADKLGYSLSKKSYVRFVPCTCGHNKRIHTTRYIKEKDAWEDIYECRNCGKKVSGYNENDAKLNWNKEMRGENA